MDPKEQARLYKERWDRAAPMLEEVRRRELAEVDQEQAIADLSPVIDWALANLPPRTTSGLAEQQRLFRIWAERRGLVPPRKEEPPCG